MDLVAAACTVRWAASLLLCNVVNWAKSYVQVEYANMEFFYSKTYIIIPTCTYDDSLPSSPRLPACRQRARIGGRGERHLCCPWGTARRTSRQRE